MKVIKRDGRAVDYDSSKIKIAIEKANKEVSSTKRASEEDIEGIIAYIEELNKKRILVEDIQDIIEEKLMELKKYELAKKYIVYRYTRALVRKQNTTDETILGIIRNDNGENDFAKNKMIASSQRNFIAGAVSRDLTKRLLLPEKIAKADEDGIIHFHRKEYFVHPMINSCIVDISNMLDNGTVINGVMIESPKSFLVACAITSQIIAGILGNQYGEQSIDMAHFGKYLRKSHERNKEQIENEYGKSLSQNEINDLVEKRVRAELEYSIQLIQYQINMLEIATGKKTRITLFLHLDEKDPYIKENAKIIEEILKQRLNGVKDENGEKIAPKSPNLVYVLDECNSLNGGEYDYLTELAIKCTKERKSPSYISAKKMRAEYNGNVFSPMEDGNFLSPWRNTNGEYKFEGRFNQGIVSINLPKIVKESNKSESEFWKKLDEALDLAFEALMCRHYALVGIKSDISPLHWQYGAISRLESGETIDALLRNGYSTLTLGYTGLYEMKDLIKKDELFKNENDFELKVIKHIKEVVEKWKKETSIGFTLCSKTPFISQNKEEDFYEKLKHEAEIQKISTGGAISQIDINNMDENEIKKLIKFIYNNVKYAQLV